MLSYNSVATSVTYGASADELQADLDQIPALNGNVSVSGSGTSADPYLVTFDGALAGLSVWTLAAAAPALIVVDAASDANAIHTTYNADGSIASIGDDFSDYTYTYDGQGNPASVDNGGSPNMPRVVLKSGYDAAGNRASLAATIYNGATGTADFVNSYSYDELSRLTDLMQQGVTSGNSVAPKQVYYTLDPIGDVTGIDRSNSVTPGPDQNGPGYSTLSYNPQGLLSAIDHLHDGTQLENMIYTYDALDRVSTFQSNDGKATYGYDSVDEVTSANYSIASGGHQSRDESYSFDQNGNRATMDGVTATAAVNNEVTSDGTFTYTFDADGNRLTRTRDSGDPEDDQLVSYFWDARNRLVEVQNFNNAGSLTEQIDYTSDVFDHLIERVDDKIGGSTTTTQYVWDGDNIVLSFDNGALAARYLNGPNTSASDQYFSTLAEENVGSGATTWDLLDNQGSLRDVIDSNGNVIDHLNYNSFGQKSYESAPTVSHIDGYAGGLYDPSTQLIYFIHRWYDPTAAVCISFDPAGFAAGDNDLTRYVGNNATNATDPQGEFIIPALAAIGAAYYFFGSDNLAHAPETGQSNAFRDRLKTAAAKQRFQVGTSAVLLPASGLVYAGAAGQFSSFALRGTFGGAAAACSNKLGDDIVMGVAYPEDLEGIFSYGQRGFSGVAKDYAATALGGAATGLFAESVIAVGGKLYRLALPGRDTAPKLVRIELNAVEEQARYLALKVPGLTEEQALLLLREAYKRKSSVVIGGSRVRGDHRPDSDLDVGYGCLTKAQAQRLNERASILGPLKLDRTPIVPGFESKLIRPKILSPEEFFQRGGVRGAGELRAGEPYSASGSITARPGEIILIPPGFKPL